MPDAFRGLRKPLLLDASLRGSRCVTLVGLSFAVLLGLVPFLYCWEEVPTAALAAVSKFRPSAWPAAAATARLAGFRFWRKSIQRQAPGRARAGNVEKKGPWEDYYPDRELMPKRDTWDDWEEEMVISPDEEVLKPRPPPPSKPKPTVAPIPQFEANSLMELVNTSVGVPIPRLFYSTFNVRPMGVLYAIKRGFPGIAVGISARAQYEVGAALATMMDVGVKRSSIFIQAAVPLVETIDFQWPRNVDFEEEKQRLEQQLSTMPVGERNKPLPIKTRMELTFRLTLNRLDLEYLDMAVLPYTDHKETLEAWKSLEDEVRNGNVRTLGLTNVKTASQLEKFYKSAKIKPVLVSVGPGEGSKYTTFQMAREIQRVCIEKGIYVQCEWNTEDKESSKVMQSNVIKELSRTYQESIGKIFFRFIMGLGICLSTDELDEIEDLSAWYVPLTMEDARDINRWRSFGIGR